MNNNKDLLLLDYVLSSTVNSAQVVSELETALQLSLERNKKTFYYSVELNVVDTSSIESKLNEVVRVNVDGDGNSEVEKKDNKLRRIIINAKKNINYAYAEDKKNIEYIFKIKNCLTDIKNSSFKLDNNITKRLKKSSYTLLKNIELYEDLPVKEEILPSVLEKNVTLYENTVHNVFRKHPETFYRVMVKKTSLSYNNRNVFLFDNNSKVCEKKHIGFSNMELEKIKDLLSSLVAKKIAKGEPNNESETEHSEELAEEGTIEAPEEAPIRAPEKKSMKIHKKKANKKS